MAARRTLAAAALAALIATGCGGDDDGDARASAKPVGQESAGSVVQFADCADWRDGSEAERFATIEVLRDALTPLRSETAESPLADERAYEILQKACSSGYAKRLRLYKLYVRAQGFAPLND